MPSSSSKNNISTTIHNSAVLTLIRDQRSMVLATGTRETPWAAPVYYVFRSPGFYFFSSPRARHIEHAIDFKRAGAAIFFDNGQWEQIQGLQMSGSVKVVTNTMEKVKIGARFILKFPFAEAFLHMGSNTKPNQSAASPKLGDRIQLYGFFPEEIYYLNNKIGFGKRERIEL